MYEWNFKANVFLDKCKVNAKWYSKKKMQKEKQSQKNYEKFVSFNGEKKSK